MKQTRKQFEPYAKPAELVDRGVYRVYARNIGVGVWDAGRGGFTGIRTKFGCRFLDTEYHWDTGLNGDIGLGTAKPIRQLEIQLPAGIPLGDTLPGTVEGNTGRPVEFDETPAEDGNGIKDGKKVIGWVFIDTREKLDIKTQHPTGRANDALFEFLEKVEADLDRQDKDWRIKE